MSGEGYRDLNEFFDPGLRLPIGGKKYQIPPIDAETGLYCQALVDAGLAEAQGSTPSEADTAKLDDLAERDLYRDLLGPAYDQMIRDGVSWPALQHAAQTALIHFTAGEEAAEEFWLSGGKPQPRQPGDHKAAGGQTRQRSSRSTGAASTTRQRASTSGTTSRSGSSRATSASKGKGSRGGASSSTGR